MKKPIIYSAVIDNFKKKYSQLDPDGPIVWKRVMDMNDRSLRQDYYWVVLKANGTMREDSSILPSFK